MLERATLLVTALTHAYLMLLPVEVTAFHPIVLLNKHNRLVSVALFLDLLILVGRLLAATVPYGVRTFLDTKHRGCPAHPTALIIPLI